MPIESVLEEQEQESGDLFVKIMGKTFRCEVCKSNVFRKPHPVSEPHKYKCNGCERMYTGA